jgi:hydrogenase maturation protease
MNLALVEPIVNAVLYEGYMLYPYRPSSVKNRQRWTFGGVYPQAYSETQSGSDVWTVQTECLIVGDQQDALPQLELKVRFLHLLARVIGELTPPLAELTPGVEPDFRVVAALRVGEKLFQTWQEVTERAIDIADVRLSDLLAGPQRLTFIFGPSRTLEPLREAGGAVVGVSVREQQRIEGAVELAAEQVDEAVFKVSVRVLNLTPLAASDLQDREAALLRSFASTHMILGARGGTFSSLFDPPEQLREATAGCRNIGVWPVLVGEAPARDMLLASPIILYDYPQIAPESPGDLFDGTEIDEILTLRIMTMTEDEKREMIAVDERARAMLERTDALAREQMLGLHGVMRGMRSLGEAP